MPHLSRISVFFLIAAAGLWMLAACAKAPSITGTPDASAAPGQAATPTRSLSQEKTAAGKPVAFPQVSSLDELDSYRMTITSHSDDSGDKEVSTIEVESVKSPAAKHTTMKNSAGAVTTEIITIGDQTWVWSQVMGWIETKSSSSQASTNLPSDLESTLKQLKSDIGAVKPVINLVGSEKINGILCQHYKLEYQMSTEFPNLATGGTRKADVHSLTEMWVADQKDTPPVILQATETVETTISGEKSTLVSERKVFDINKPITISAPGGVKTPSGGQATQAPRTATPKPGSATLPSTAVKSATPPRPATISPTSGSAKSGYVSVTDASMGDTWYWVAPAKFLKAAGAAYGGTLSFYLKQSTLELPYDEDDVALVSGDLRLVFDTPVNPGLTWTLYRIPLIETAGWVNKDTGELATRAEMQAALAGLDALLIRGEFDGAGDIGGLDGVSLVNAQGASLAASNFDANDEGWTAQGDVEPKPDYFATGGS